MFTREQGSRKTPMTEDAPASKRAREILCSIVLEYIETGEPVASQTIARRRKHNLSAASIRNVMAELTDAGYLSQPHTSAGRVPTEKAFRHYARTVNARRGRPGEAERLRAELSELHTIAERMERASHILTELTRNVGIAVALPSTGQLLDQIELVSLGDRRVLIIVVTQDHVAHERVVALGEPISPEELASIRNYVNRNFSGWTLNDARRELVRRLAEERVLFEDVMRKLSLLYQKGLLEVDSSPELHMEGASNLVGLDSHITGERLRELLRALEEKKRVIELLDRFLEQSGGELTVHVGLGDVHPAMKELALIGLSFSMPAGLGVKVAVLGPMRMRYDVAMSAVLQTGRALEHASF